MDYKRIILPPYPPPEQRLLHPLLAALVAFVGFGLFGLLLMAGAVVLSNPPYAP